MDQNKIGNFISTERKRKKLTQKELAEKLRISEKTISKWECGKGLPEVSLMKPLCQELDISVTELLNGEKEIKEKSEEAIINYIDYNKKKSTHKIIILSIIFTLLIAFILSTVCFFFNTYNKIAVYRLYGESEHFHINDLYVTKSNMYNILSTGNIEIKNKNILAENVLEIDIKSENRIIVGTSYSNYNGKTLIEKNGYNELFDEEKLNNIENWYIEVVYKVDNEIKRDKINLNSEEVMKNNEFISPKVEHIGYDNQTEEEQDEFKRLYLERFNKQCQNLIDNGYTESYKDELYGFFARYIKENKNEIYGISISHSNPKIEYKNQFNKSTEIYINLTINSQHIEKNELEGYVIKDDLIYNFVYYKDIKKFEYTTIQDQNLNAVDMKEYPSINNIENICQNLLDLQLELFDILVKPYI